MKEKILFENFQKKEKLHYRFYPEMMESLKALIIDSFTVEVEVDMYSLVGRAVEETLKELRNGRENDGRPSISRTTIDEFNMVVNLSLIYAVMIIIAKTSQEAKMKERDVSELVSNTTQCIMSFLNLSDRQRLCFLDRIRLYKMRLGLL